MTKKKKTKQNFITHIIRKISHKKTMVIFLGLKGVTLSAFDNNKLINSIFIKQEKQNNIDKYKKFFKLYRKYEIFFLLDTPHSELTHETMPMFQSILKTNPVNHFISTNYNPEDIVTYNVYNIQNTDGEIWETVIASAIYEEPLNTLLDYVITNSFQFKGVYFLHLEFEEIINNLLEKFNYKEYDDHLQIFATITKSSDIKIVTKHRKNIMDVTTIDYPEGKSDAYVKGTFDQAINDALLAQKHYIKSLSLEACVIIFCAPNLATLLIDTSYEPHKLIVISSDQLDNKSIPDEPFQDNNLFAILEQNYQYVAVNKALKSIKQLSFVNSIIFKPLIALIIILLAALITLKYQTVLTQDNINTLNDQYYSISKNYRDIQQRYPDIKNISTLTDLYYLESILKSSWPMPFEDIKTLFLYNHPNIEISHLLWNLNEENIIFAHNLQPSIMVELIYSDNTQNITSGIKELDQFINHLTNIYNSSKVTHTKDLDNIIKLPQKIIIPATIVITGSLGGKK